MRTGTRAGGEGSSTWSGWCVHCSEAITLLSIATNIISYTVVHPLLPITNNAEMKMKPYRAEGPDSAALTALWLALVATPIGRLIGLMVVMMIAAGVLGLGSLMTLYSYPTYFMNICTSYRSSIYLLPTCILFSGFLYMWLGGGCGRYRYFQLLTVRGWVSVLVEIGTGEGGQYRALKRKMARARVVEKEKMEKDRWRLYYQQGDQPPPLLSPSSASRGRGSSAADIHYDGGGHVKGINSGSGSGTGNGSGTGVKSSVKGAAGDSVHRDNKNQSPFLLSPALHPIYALLLALVPMLTGPTLLTTLTGGSFRGE